MMVEDVPAGVRGHVLEANEPNLAKSDVNRALLLGTWPNYDNHRTLDVAALDENLALEVDAVVSSGRRPGQIRLRDKQQLKDKRTRA